MKADYYELARQFRKEPTQAEKLLWEELRNCKTGYKIYRQYVINFDYDNQHRGFIADFYCHKTKTVIELDGKIHKLQQDYDKLRTHIINQLGISVLRFENEEIVKNIDNVLECIKCNFSKQEGKM